MWNGRWDFGRRRLRPECDRLAFAALSAAARPCNRQGAPAAHGGVAGEIRLASRRSLGCSADAITPLFAVRKVDAMKRGVA